MRLNGLAVVLALHLVLVPRAAVAQQPTHVHRFGWLADPSPGFPGVEAFLDGMLALGYVEGQHLGVEHRWGEGQYEWFPAPAAELVRLEVDAPLSISGGARTALAFGEPGEQTIHDGPVSLLTMFAAEPADVPQEPPVVPAEPAVPTLESASELGRDWPGIIRDTGWFMAYQAAALGLSFLLPDVDEEELKDYGDYVTNPRFDPDQWWVNYIIHPYWGATYYVRARERGFGAFGSFAYSALLSTLFEFGIEAFYERPSYQDLIVTPVLGSLVGAFVFEPIRNRIKAKPQRKWYDQFGLIATDPLGAINGFFEWLFGIRPELSLQFRPLSPAGQRDRLPPSAEQSFNGSDRAQRRGQSVRLEIILRF
jgi:hypothetical protein